MRIVFQLSACTESPVDTHQEVGALSPLTGMSHCVRRQFLLQNLERARRVPECALSTGIHMRHELAGCHVRKLRDILRAISDVSI